ncbi:MAG: DUF951 domain-containing protein [Clostridia bacterium]|nr:DUF951 domain-containing protein [Clostridia bacterium]
MLLHVGDLVKMRKAHHCGNDVWRITSVCADIKMRCEKCQRIVMLERPVFEKRVRKLLESAGESEA